jgi:hypothetical protein
MKWGQVFQKLLAGVWYMGYNTPLPGAKTR